MPRNATVELAYIPLQAEALNVGPAKAVLQAGWEKVVYNVDQPLEPIVFRLYIPKFTVKALNAKPTFFLTDVTGAAQIIGEAQSEGITAAASAAPLLLERRITPSKDFTIEPEREGGRSLNVEVEVSAESITVPANTAKCVAFLQIIGLGRQ